MDQRLINELVEDIESAEITNGGKIGVESTAQDEKLEEEPETGVDWEEAEVETHEESGTDEGREVEKDREVSQDEKEWDFEVKKLVPINYPSKSAVGAGKEASDLRVVNSKKGGKRLVLKLRVLERLELDDTVLISKSNDKIILTKGEGAGSYKLKKQGKHYMIYNSNLVKDVTKTLNLNFQNCTSRNLEVKYIEKAGKTYLVARKERE